MRDHWSDDHCRWLKQYFPELETTPLYIRRLSEVAGLTPVVGALAYTSITLDTELRGSLESHGQWEGRGVAVAIQDVEAFNRLSWHRQLAILLHEAARWFAGADSPLRRPISEWTLLDHVVATQIGRDALDAAFGTVVDEQAVQLAHHGPTFARTGLHMWWRTRREIDLNHMCIVSPVYHSPSERSMIEALGSELEFGGNLVSILRTPMPQEFASLWPSYKP